MRKVVSDFLLAVFTQNEIIDHARTKGTGAIESAGSDDVFKAAWFKFNQHIFDTRRLELKDAGGISSRHQAIGLGVVIADQLKVKIRILPLMNQAHRVRDNSQSLEAEKVELNQTDLFDILHGELGHLGTRLGLGIQG